MYLVNINLFDVQISIIWINVRSKVWFKAIVSELFSKINLWICFSYFFGLVIFSISERVEIFCRVAFGWLKNLGVKKFSKERSYYVCTPLWGGRNIFVFIWGKSKVFVDLRGEVEQSCPVNPNSTTLLKSLKWPTPGWPFSNPQQRNGRILINIDAARSSPEVVDLLC